MARFTLHAPISGCRGKLGGVVFSQNSHGPYLRVKNTRSNPATPAQAAVRSRMAYAQNRWHAMSQVVKDNWAWFALNPPEHPTNALGLPLSLTGHQWFIRCALRHLAVGQQPQATPPSGQTATPPTNLQLVPAFHCLAICAIGWTLGDFTVWDTIIIQCATANHPHSKSPDTPWRNVYYEFAPPGWSRNIYTHVVNAIGRPPLGTLFFARLFKQKYAGSRSPRVTITGTVI